MKKTFFAIAMLLATSAAAAPIAVTGTFTTGGATVGTDPGPFTLTSTDATYSILRFIPDQTFTFADLLDVNIDYTALLGGIGGGAPRLAFVGTSGNAVYANFGPAGSFADPTLGPGNSGNLVAMFDLGRYDNQTGGAGGAFYSTYAEALALFGGETIQRLSLIIDSFGGNDRAFLIPAGGFNVVADIDVAPAPVPEPATLMLFGLGLAAIGARQVRKRMAR